jgi:hypothetical protein
MDLESITLYLNNKHLSAVAIHAEINSVLGEGTIGYSTVTRYLQKQSFVNASHLAPEEPDLGAADIINNVILQVLDEQLVASPRQIAKRPLIPMSTVQSRLVNKMTYKLKHCEWSLTSYRRYRNRPESLHQNVSWICWVQSSTRAGNILRPWTKPGFISRINTNKSGSQIRNTRQQFNDKRSAVRKQC